MNEPIRHHYIPKFYLSNWVGSDGRVCCFSQPIEKIVKAKRVVPKGTGFACRLYETRGLRPERAQAMEKNFMAKLDDKAAKALELLMSDLPDEEWTPGPRSDWSRFILTQMLRTPQDIAQLQSSVGQECGKLLPNMEDSYIARRSDTDPPTFRE